INIGFNVTSAVPATLAIDSQRLSFAFSRGGAPQQQPLTISNTGGGVLRFDVAAMAMTPVGSNWLQASPSVGQASPTSSPAIQTPADPTGLIPGAYRGLIIVNAGTTIASIPVTMTISDQGQVLLLSQRGLSFISVANGGLVPGQSFAV